MRRLGSAWWGRELWAFSGDFGKLRIWGEFDFALCAFGMLWGLGAGASLHLTFVSSVCGIRVSKQL